MNEDGTRVRDAIDAQVGRLYALLPAAQAGERHELGEFRQLCGDVAAAINVALPVLAGKPAGRLRHGLSKLLDRLDDPAAEARAAADALPAATRKRLADALDWLDKRLDKAEQKATKRRRATLETDVAVGTLSQWLKIREQFAHADEAITELAGQALHNAATPVEAGRLAALLAAAGKPLPADVSRPLARLAKPLAAADRHAAAGRWVLAQLGRRGDKLDEATAAGVAEAARLVLQKAARERAKADAIWQAAEPALGEVAAERFPLTTPATPPSADAHIPAV